MVIEKEGASHADREKVTDEQQELHATTTTRYDDGGKKESHRAKMNQEQTLSHPTDRPDRAVEKSRGK